MILARELAYYERGANYGSSWLSNYTKDMNPCRLPAR